MNNIDKGNIVADLILEFVDEYSNLTMGDLADLVMKIESLYLDTEIMYCNRTFKYGRILDEQDIILQHKIQKRIDEILSTDCVTCNCGYKPINEKLLDEYNRLRDCIVYGCHHPEHKI